VRDAELISLREPFIHTGVALIKNILHIRIVAVKLPHVRGGKLVANIEKVGFPIACDPGSVVQRERGDVKQALWRLQQSVDRSGTMVRAWRWS
jgi:hypothetical protein